MSFFKVGVCAPLEYAVWQSAFLRPGLLVTFKCECAACARLNLPLLSALHRFFVPLCVLSFGKLVMADVENCFAVVTRRERNMW